MTVTINAVSSTGLVQTSDGSGVIKLQSNGVATNALAWVNFSGSTPSISANYNVSSVTRTATGTFTIAFTSALADANYVPTVCGSSNGTNSTVPWAYINSNVTQTTGQFGCYF